MFMRRFDSRHFEQRLDLGSESEFSAALPVIKRLDSEMIASQKQLRRRAAQIADGEGKHAIQAVQAVFEAVGTIFFVEMNDNFGVGVRAKTMAGLPSSSRRRSAKL